jgi:hypothetical protein
MDQLSSLIGGETTYGESYDGETPSVVKPPMVKPPMMKPPMVKPPRTLLSLSSLWSSSQRMLCTGKMPEMFRKSFLR